MTEIEEAVLVKGGEAVIRINIHRNVLSGKFQIGCVLTVWIHPRIEDFVRQMGNGELLDVSSMGRYWVATEKEKPLVAYSLSSLHPSERESFTLDRLGQPLIQDNEGGLAPKMTNLSILRLVGASEGAGISFGVRGVYTLDQLRRTRDQLMDATRQFYLMYLKPVNLSIIVSTQEITP